MFNKSLRFTGDTLTYIQEINRIIKAERFKAEHMKGNTALVKNAKVRAEECDELANLLQGVLDSFVSQQLVNLGIPQSQRTSLDLKTGNIKYEK